MEEPSCNRRLVKGGTISDIIQKEAKKISSPVMSDFLIAARRGFTEQVLQGLKEGGSGKALSTDKVRAIDILAAPRSLCSICKSSRTEEKFSLMDY